MLHRPTAHKQLPGPDWADLVALEPRLANVEDELLATAFPTAFQRARRRLSELVGWSSRTSHPVLRSSHAWHVALDRLLELADQRQLLPGRAA